MKTLKSKASRFFRDPPSQDEKIAHTELNGDVDFSAGIQSHGMKYKPSRFFTRKTGKVDKSPPVVYETVPLSLVACQENQAERDSSLDEPPVTSTAFRFPQVSSDLAPSPLPSSYPSSTHSSCKQEADSQKVRPRPSFATLRTKSSRFFRNNGSRNSSPPPPPVPQIPVDPEAPQPRRLNLVPVHVPRNSRSSLILPQGGHAAISRPVHLPQYSNLPIPENAATVPFTKPAGPPQSRPSRPESLDAETMTFMQQSGMRMVIGTSNRASNSTASSSTPRSYTSSIEARLGFPSGHSTPRSDSLDSPLAARFPLDTFQPLPIRDSTGSLKFSRFSEYVRAERGGYAGDGVDEADRELGPIEQFDKAKEDQWTLEKRVSQGPNGNSGMLFRDKAGAFHFVADI
ncbi:hypothetical protein HBI82_060030 [Parastagonospora nodorum]|nr:hypothetical protein HBH50_122260 [Parastagonospora nodorum]KAH4085685.1 hypothetical protein HBH48_152900 [Parastagonospora nodorum]KAH4103025.1 hypothetical protein HBH46_121450 [Parastagonospora nodorum]KAH4848954.1 hypothetical protein HBH75_148900 [Parastagonospora nodorum]KAH5028127.1 hypothetical protein HBI74_116980 [Parastagonospora nodorum]